VNGNVGLTTVTFPALTTVQNDVEITVNRQLASVSLPVLKDVRAFAARYDDPLAALTLPALETTRGQLDFSSNAQLATIALPAWTTGDALVVEVGPALTAFQAPKVRTLEFLKINQNQSLPTIALPSLVRVNTGFFITSNAHLPTCRALALRDQVVAAMGIGGTIQVQGNDDAGVCN
jgi:hypothetical protein